MSKIKQDIRTVITKHTKIELGLMVTILGVLGSGLVFIAKSIAEIDDHGQRLHRIETREEKFEAVANDVSYLKGRFDTEFPPRKRHSN